MNSLSWIELDAGAFAHNLAQYKRITNNRLLAPVLKSNAYGHGLISMGMLCQACDDVDIVVVMTIKEGLQLRAIGLSKPILVLAPDKYQLSEGITAQFQFVVPSLEFAYILIYHAQEKNVIIPIHIKVDTGLNRYGFRVDEIDSWLTEIVSPYLSIVGIMSHFIQVDPTVLHLARAQYARFVLVIEYCKARGVTPTYIHMSNTAASLLLDQPECTMIRLGIGAYGIWASESIFTMTQQRYPGITLQPVLTFKARITQLRKVKAGESVSYSATYIAQDDMNVAVLPIGYYDGFDFNLHDTGVTVVVQGRHVPVIGRICMNSCMIDVTGIAVHVGDEITIVGNGALSVSDLCKLVGIVNPRIMLVKYGMDIPRCIVNALPVGMHITREYDTHAQINN